MIRAVFDANVLASGFVGLSRAGAEAPAVLLRLWMLGRFSLITSEEILSEVEESASRNPISNRLCRKRPERVPSRRCAATP